MKSRFNVLVIMIAFAILSMSMLAVAETYPVYSNYRGTPEQNGNPTPLAISHFPHSLSIWIIATG